MKSLVKQVFTEKQNRRYEKQLQGKRIGYKQWLSETLNEEADEGAGLGDFVVFVSSEGNATADAMSTVGRFFQENPEVLIVYGDEDVRSREWGYPWYKPDWSPDLFRSRFYFGSFVAVRCALAAQLLESGFGVDSFSERMDCGISGAKISAGCERPIPLYRVTSLDAYVKWMEHCVKHAGGYKKGCKVIGHIPEILYSCNTEEEQEKFLRTWGNTNTGEETAFGQKGKISVIIPSKDNPEILSKCVEALATCIKTTELTVEIVVVDNGSSMENREKVQALLAHVSSAGVLQTIYRYEPMEFNFSKMCNWGTEIATGDYLLFLNDDVELCMPEVLPEMYTLASQEYTGAVGLKLHYPDSERIQHAGITNLPMGPVHKLQFLEDNKCYYYGANCGNRNVLAVTAACMMVSKEKFLEAGGFSEELRVAFNDVDLCFSLYELGYHNVCINDRYAYHHESLSRGADESAEQLNRLLEEREKLYRRHPKLEGVDPYYSKHLNHDGLDTRIRPGYLTARNRTQRPVGEMKTLDLEGYRRDECLLVRVEDFRHRHGVGYGVVLGDNNACYEKRLLLAAADDTHRQKSIYYFDLEGQYRQDLEENMPDQVNVALSGYDVIFGENVMPKGVYRIGMAARNRVTGLKLVNWTNRYVDL